MDGREDSILVKRIAAYTQYPSILQFTSYSEILVGICNFFLPLAFNAPVGVFPLEFLEKFGPHKTRIVEIPCEDWCEDRLTIGWAVFSTQYQRVTDGRTDIDV